MHPGKLKIMNFQIAFIIFASFQKFVVDVQGTNKIFCSGVARNFAPPISLTKGQLN